MTFTNEQLYKFGHFHKAMEALVNAGEKPTAAAIAEKVGLSREQLDFCIDNRTALTKAARDAGLIQ